MYTHEIIPSNYIQKGKEKKKEKKEKNTHVPNLKEGDRGRRMEMGAVVEGSWVLTVFRVGFQVRLAYCCTAPWYSSPLLWQPQWVARTQKLQELALWKSVLPNS